MRIIKRNGSEEDFNIEKIINAVKKANGSGEHKFLTDEQIEDVADYVEYKCNKIRRAVSVEEIQDMVEDQLMAKGAFELARRYVRYRYNRSLVRKANTTDNRILSLIECNNEEVKQENSNKNPTVNSVQRDYMAGEVSRDLTRRMLLPADIVETVGLEVAMRVKATLACTECKQRNYNTMKNKKNNPERIEMQKYCKFCKKSTLHKETK